MQKRTTKKPRGALLLLSSTAWTLHAAGEGGGREPIGAGAWDGEDAEYVAQAVRQSLGHDGRLEVVVALESDLCLSTDFAAPAQRRLRTRDALLYQIEETLPVAAEDVAADLLIHSRRVLAVCCDAAWLARLSGALAAANLAVRGVTPGVLLAFEGATSRPKDAGRCCLAWQREDSIELVSLIGNRPVELASLPRDAVTLQQEVGVRALAVGGAPKLYLVGGRFDYLSGGESAQLRQIVEDNPDAERLDVDFEAAASTGAERVLSGEATLGIDLLRGGANAGLQTDSPLRGNFSLLQASVAVLLLAIAWYGYRVASLARADSAAAAAANDDIFRRVFPDKRVPTGVRARLASELRRLKGVQGQDGGAPTVTAAMDIVGSVLESLPAGMRFRLLEIRVDERRVYLEGEARSHGDADRIAAALRNASLRVDPPRTTQLPDRGVGFRLTAESQGLDSKTGPADKAT